MAIVRNFLHLLLLLLITGCYCGTPLSNCETDPCQYNMIDTNPDCWSQGLCPFQPGGRWSSFPNSEERMQHQMKNMFRMHANETIDLPLGRLTGGLNGDPTTYAEVKYCGTTTSIYWRAPMYWYSLANQMARFKQWDEEQCDRCWFVSSGSCSSKSYCMPSSSGHSDCGDGSPHDTCHWNLDGNSDCVTYMGGDGSGGYCGFDTRSALYGSEDDSDITAETICGNNYCYTDGHCTPIFTDAVDYQGNGFVPNTNGIDTTYSSNGIIEADYLIPGVAHYDERIKVPEADRHVNGKYFGILLEYYDRHEIQSVDKCYALYSEYYHEMDIYVQLPASDQTAFPGGTHSAFLNQNFYPPNQCEPYAVLCRTTLGNFVRLPESTDYYFGTEWLDWSWTDYWKYGNGYLCKENHYYNDGTEWIANGGPTLTTSEIWYYQNTTSYGTCLGCSHIDKLICWETCIRSDFAPASCDCGTTAPTMATPAPVPQPTRVPTDPTETPTKLPTTPTTPTIVTTYITEIHESGDEQGGGGNGNNGNGGLIGAIIGGLVALILMIIAGYYAAKKQREKEHAPEIGTAKSNELPKQGSIPKLFGKISGVKTPPTKHHEKINESDHSLSDDTGYPETGDAKETGLPPPFTANNIAYDDDPTIYED